jgi:hypothetical protein
MKKLLIGALALVSLTAGADLKPRTVTSGELPEQGELIFTASVDDTFAAIKQVAAGRTWKLLYEGDEPPKKEHAYFSNSAPLSGKSYDRIAWDKSAQGPMPPKKYLQAKTPTSAFSFGAELFVTVFEAPNGGSVVAITASTSQVREKDKLEGYIEAFTADLNLKVH